MKALFEWLVVIFLRLVLKLRYRIRYKGLQYINKGTLNRPGGVLVLPNHTAMGIDPISIITALWSRYKVRPLIVEYMYYATGIHSLMKLIGAIPVPNNEVSSNSLKKKRSDRALHEVVLGLKRGENYLMYPSGRLKDTGYEFIGGASGTYRILSEFPEANIVLVRLVGLWGSSFSKAYTGYSPPLFPTLMKGIKHTFKNLIFFNPRRNLTVEYIPAPDDFPRYGTRMEINKWLEDWYNRPEGLHEVGSGVIGEPLKRVSYSIWRKEYLEPVATPERAEEDPNIELDKIPEETKKKITRKLAEVANIPQSKIRPDMFITRDLSLDSLDIAELVLFLDDEFDVKGVPVIELSTVGRMMGIAARQVNLSEQKEPEVEISGWFKDLGHEVIGVAPGETIPEVFLNNAERNIDRPACADDRSGVLTYKKAKLGVMVLAEYIRTLPGDHIGIMLPASVGASLTVLAAQLAGKVPVMINWTLGPRHLSSVMESANLKVILSSWAFIDRLGNVDLDCIDNELIMLEDARRHFSLKMKLKGLLLSKKKPKKILEHFGADKLKKDQTAVVLFTSGTEKAPKGVPLSHTNILSNVRSICDSVEVFSDDVYFSMLPPFHSFGITAGIYFSLLSGMRCAFYPNPTNGLGLAKAISKWKATVVTGAPTFLKGMLKAGRPEQFTSLRWFVTGAEKAPPEMYRMMEAMGMPGVLREGYGCTETSPVLTVNRLDEEPKGVGRPLERVTVKIVHPQTHKEMKTNEEGLVIAKGDNVFSGYLNKMAGDPFINFNGEKYYNTGDLGFLDEKNRLTISGRLKRFIKSGGEMISLGAIEDALLTAAPNKGWQLSGDLPSVAVCGRESVEGKPEIITFTIFPVTVEEVNKTLREQGFSNLVKVTQAVHVNEIPIMGTGKIFYRDLEGKYFV